MRIMVSKGRGKHMEKFERFDRRRLASLLIAVVVSAISIFVVAPIVKNPKTWGNAIEYLDQKHDTVLELVEGSASMSFLLTLLPDDAGTSIANELSKYTEYFLLILAVLLLEKYSLTIFGFISAAVMIPILAFGFWYYYEVNRNQMIRRWLSKLLIFVIVLVCLVPASVLVSQLIENTHDYSINAATEAAKEANEAAVDAGNDGNKNVLDRISDAIGKVVSGVSGAIDWAKKGLKNTFDALAIMLVTSCAIPLLVALIFVKVLNYVFRLALPVSIPHKKALPDKKEEERMEEE